MRKSKTTTQLAGALLFAGLAWSVCGYDHITAAWTAYLGGEYGDDRALAVAACSDGGFYGGESLERQFQRNNASTISLYSSGFVAKVATDGALLWVRDFSASDHKSDKVLALAATTDDGVVAAGQTNSGANEDTFGFLSKLTSDGTIDWHAPLMGGGDYAGTNSFNAVAIDANGAIYVAGVTSASNLAYNVTGYTHNATTYGTELKGGTDIIIARYAANGDLQWRHYLGGQYHDTALALAVSESGALYVAGQTHSPDWATLGGAVNVDKSNAAGFIAKFDSNGGHIWSAYIDGTANDVISALRAGDDDVLHLGGSTASSDLLAGVTRLNSHTGGADGFVACLTDTNTAFRIEWLRFVGGAGHDSVTALAPLADGRLAVGGATSSGGWFTPVLGSQGYQGGGDGFIALLDADDGSLSWATCLGGGAGDEVRALASGATDLLVAGATFSEGWVGGGFMDEWRKDDLWGDEFSYGFAGRWQPGLPLAPTIIAQPVNRSVMEHESVAFTVAASGTAPLHYRWRRDGVQIAGATSSNLTFSAAYADDGALYTCLVSNLMGSVTSLAATLSVTPVGTLSVQLAPAEAITRGARWRLAGGAWLDGGISTNLASGAYTIDFVALPGWHAPATTNVIVAHAATTSIVITYVPIAPEAERSITGTNVTLTVRAPAGVGNWTLTETLPAALTPTHIDGGVWSNATHTITFSGGEATTNTLGYTVAAATSGVYLVTGAIKTPHVSAPWQVGGDGRILSARFQRAINGNQVTISFEQSSASAVWLISETIPPGLTPVNITGPLVSWDSQQRQLLWLKVGLAETLTYEVEGEPGSYELSGTGSINNVVEPIFGDTTLVIGGAPEAPAPAILAFEPLPNGHYALTFTSVVDRTYMILTNGALENAGDWAPYLVPVAGAGATTQCEVAPHGPRLFYRVREVEP